MSNNTNLPKCKRKEKSLSLLAQRFLGLCMLLRDDKICLNETATALKVGRRRIYDVVNILEALGVVERRGKNLYRWKGLQHINNTIARLRMEACDQWANSIGSLHEDGDDICSSNTLTVAARRAKSLGSLCEKFIRLFFERKSQKEFLSLDAAATTLMQHRNTGKGSFKSRVRRLYDIANVLTALGLIEKVFVASSRKPAFDWIAPVDDLTGNLHTQLQQQQQQPPSSSSSSSASALVSHTSTTQKSVSTPSSLFSKSCKTSSSGCQITNKNYSHTQQIHNTELSPHTSSTKLPHDFSPSHHSNVLNETLRNSSGFYTSSSSSSSSSSMFVSPVSQTLTTNSSAFRPIDTASAAATAPESSSAVFTDKHKMMMKMNKHITQIRNMNVATNPFMLNYTKALDHWQDILNDPQVYFGIGATQSSDSTN